MTMIDYKLAVFIERLYNLNVVGVNAIANELGLPYSVLQSRINQLIRLGFRLRGLIDSLELKLIETYIITKNDPPMNIKEVKFARNISALIPEGGFLIFYVPVDEDLNKFINNVIENYNLDVVRIIIVSLKELKKTSLIRYRWDLDSITDASRIHEWTKIIDDYENIVNRFDNEKYNNNYFKRSFNERLKRVMKYKRLPLDSVCLKVLKEIERDPLRRIRDIAEITEVPFKKALKCVRIIMDSRIYKGIRMRTTPWGRFTDLYAISIVKAPSPVDALALLESVTRFPLSAGASISIDKEVIMVFRINSKIYDVFRLFLKHFERDTGFDVKWFGASPISMVKRFTIPYKQGFEYSKYKKGWLSEF